MVSSLTHDVSSFYHTFSFFSGTVLNTAEKFMRKYLMGLRILAALIIVSRASFFGILIAAMGCTLPLRYNYARHGTTTVARTHTYNIPTHSYDTCTRPTSTYAFACTYVQLRCVRAILFRGGELPEECAFLVRATPSDTMVSHVPRLPNDKITAAMFAQDQRSRWECVKDERGERDAFNYAEN